MVNQTDTPSKTPATTAKPSTQKFTRGSKDFQDFERRMSKSARRVSKAVSKGVETYLDEREKSADRRRDGAILESYVNVARGLADGIADASPALIDVADAFNTKRTRRMIRSVVRAFPFPR